MEISLSQAKARFSEIVSAAVKGERVVITKHGKPVVELLGLRGRGCGGIDFKKLAEDCERARIWESGEGWPEEFDAPAFSRRVLGLD